MRRRVLSIGDLHLENFGTWRDADGRLVWGVNDFDEAAVMPYVLDLVRLATSIQLAPDPADQPRRAAEAVLRGYRDGLEEPQPALLFEGETWLRPYAEPAERQAGEILEGDRRLSGNAPPPANCQGVDREPAQGHRQENRPPLPHSPQGRRQPGTAALPRGRLLARRPGAARGQGAGALGVELGPRSGKVAEVAFPRFRQRPLSRAGSVPACAGTFIFRRIAADSNKIELGEDAGRKMHLNLLEAMGFDVASIHAAGSVASRR